MLGKTHVTTTTGTGLLGLYGLHYATQSNADVWYVPIAERVVDVMGLQFADGITARWWFLAWCLVGLALGALLPDIDSKNSTLGRYVPFVEDIVGHRTLTHTIWVVLALFGLSYYIGHPFLWMVSVGYFAHIVQDSFSKQGINWLWPFGKGFKQYGNASVKQGFHIGLYRVGGTVELCIHAAMVLLNVWMVYKWMMV